MKTTIFLIFSFVSAFSFGQSQKEMNQSAYELYNSADTELNENYEKILFEYREDSVFISNLKKSQRIWITFRDAELKVKFPEKEADFYGTVLTMCEALYLEKLTRERIATLKVWVEGIEEGDNCSGSVKFKDE